MVFPFQVNNLQEFTGKVIGDYLVSELRRIYLIHQLGHYGIKSEIQQIEFPRITPSSEILETKIAEIGEIKFFGIELPLAGIA
jgi:hypothetical protein